MKVKIEFDLGEAMRLSGDSVSDTAYTVLNNLTAYIAEPGAFAGDVNVYTWRDQKRVAVKVGEWGIE